MEKIKIILSCPQVIFREGIHFILSGEEDFDVIGETTANLEALELIEANSPHIVVLSQSDTRSDSATIARRVKENYPYVSVVLVADIIDDETLFPLIVSGVSAVFTPDIDPEEMLEVLRNTAHGQLPVLEALLTPALAARTLADFKDMASLHERQGIPVAQLSGKEAEILNGLTSGGMLGQVVAGMGISEEVARIHLRTVVQKLAANERIRTIVEKTQASISSMMPGLKKDDLGTQKYLTRAEFDEFRTILMSGFKSLVGEKS